MDPGGQFPASLKKTRWSIEKIEGLIREKIIQRCKRASREYVQAYILFGRPSKGMSKAAFNEKLGLLGLQLTDGELQALMDRYDSNRSGKIDVSTANASPNQPSAKTHSGRRSTERAAQSKVRPSASHAGAVVHGASSPRDGGKSCIKVSREGAGHAISPT